MCGFEEIFYRNGGRDKAPAYFDYYFYDGSEYLSGRITKQDLTQGSVHGKVNSILERYLKSRTKKITNGQFTDPQAYIQGAEKSVYSNDLTTIKELAGRSTKEALVSIWLYNPGEDFSVSFPTKYETDAYTLSAMKLVFGNITASDYQKLLDYVKKTIVPDISAYPEKYPEYKGVVNYIKEILNGSVTLDRGWNFLTYSKVLLNDGGGANWGNCNVTKSYVFDNQQKRWIKPENANSSNYGAGMVVYNAGTQCQFTVSNSILKTYSDLLRVPADNTPPVLP